MGCTPVLLGWLGVRMWPQGAGPGRSVCTTAPSTAAEVLCWPVNGSSQQLTACTGTSFAQPRGAECLLLPRPWCLLPYSKRHAVFLLSYRQLQTSAWLVFAGVVNHSSIKQEDGVSVRKIIYHPLYNDNSLDYDIALMKLQVPLNFSGNGLP